jgi:predicted Zn finger-like uncharacterized protein
VIITCPECDTKYRYDERRFDGEAAKRVKCTSCGFTFEAANPNLEPAAVTEPTESGQIDVVVAAQSADAAWKPAAAEVEEQTPSPTPAEATRPPDAHRESPIPPLPTDPRYSLAVIAGSQAGSVFQIHKPRILLGRGSAMDIQLRDSEVSRRHAQIEIRDPEVMLSDLGATNGTWFNGAQIQTVKLSHQDEFTLGSTTLMLIVTPVRGAQ